MPWNFKQQLAKLKRSTPSLSGPIRVGKSTKQLLRTIEPRRIIVIQHRDLDDMAAAGIIGAKVTAVINAEKTMSGHIPITGARMLLDAGIPIFEISPEHFDRFHDGMNVEINEEQFNVISNEGMQVPFRPFGEREWKEQSKRAQDNLGSQLNDFIDNTLLYASKEKEFVIKPLQIPKLTTPIEGKHVVVVVRGSGYKNDLLAIKDYIEDYRPVLIGVDGGADALLEYGFKPHMIVGDMDSISDYALSIGAELLVHAYPDGTAPGMKRIEELHLKAKTIRAPGTSEDIAMLVAYEHNAELIVTLGAHTHMTDFLQKGRKGMASTMLVRMKIGSKLIDAKGVSKLYNRPMKLRDLWIVPAAGLFPLMTLGIIHPGFRHVLDMLWLYVKLTIS